MIITRLLEADEIEAAIQLADSVFRDEHQVSMGVAYPYIFSASLRQSFGVFEEDKLLSFMGFVPAIIQLEEARLHCYSVGAVCTHADARGRGYASLLMSAVIQHANAAGASLILVSGHRSIYTRAACYPFGSMKRYMLDADNISEMDNTSAASEIHVRKWLPTDLFQLAELARKRPSRYEQSLTDLAALIHSAAFASNVRFRQQVWVAEQEGKATAFAVIAAPGERESAESSSASSDLSLTRPPFVVEWAGDSKAVSAIYAYVIRTGGLKRLHVQANWYETEIHECFASISSLPLTNSGLIHLVNLQQLCAQLEPYLRGRGGSAAELEKQLEQLDDEQRIRVLFDLIPSDQPATDLLPLPFPYTVGLNYV